MNQDGPNSRIDRGQQTGDAAAKHDRAEPRFAETHRVVHSVNRKRRMHIPAFEAGIAHAFGRFVKRGGARIFRAIP